jgi:formylglycine-generating enzyme required for sulfatase activity
VPDEVRQAEALRLASDLYHAEYSQAQTPAAQRALAKKLLQKGLEMADDPTARFVLLRLARDIAVKAGDQNLAFEAIDRLAEGFVVDSWAMKSAVVTEAARQARKTVEHETAASQALLLMRKAMEQDACGVAQEMAKLALSEGGKARDRELVAQARAGQKQAQQAAKAMEQIEASRAMLRDHPDDPLANQAVGRYECLVKGNWAVGLPLLAKAGEPGIKSVAEDDLRSPSEPAAQLKIGDAWWNLAQGATGREREGMLVRAGYWYQQVGQIEQSLVRAKIESRLTQIAKLGRTIPGEPAALQKTFTNSIGMQLVLISAGEFMMGSPPAEMAWAVEEGKKRQEADWYYWRNQSSAPLHKVRISRPFFVGIYEVTQSEYQQVMGANPSSFSAAGNHADKVAGLDTTRYPVESVSWDDAVQFCRKLSERPQERASRRVYRLPSDAEWEFACRAGTTTKWSFGDDREMMKEYGWFSSSRNLVTHAVGQKKPNRWGLYDMHGNVWEWCLDWHHPDYYQQSPAIDPPGPSTGSQRIIRGNTAEGSPASRVAFRMSREPEKSFSDLGFRVVCER